MKTQKLADRMLLKSATNFFALLFGLALFGMSIPANAGQRPIEDFLSTQGTFCLDTSTFTEGPPCDLFVPPSPNMIGWSVGPAFTIFALVDYAGLANQYLIDNGGTSLGTIMTGRINERPLADGRADVHVTLHTSNALAWVSDISTDFPGPLLFGHRVDEVLAGETAALADCFLQVRFTNTAPGAPLPDLIQLAFVPEAGQGFEIESFRCTGTGLLADGSPALLTIAQTGLFIASGQGGTADGFPAERIDLHRIGKQSLLQSAAKVGRGQSKKSRR